jgi:polar amino acid transport system substrate-binding protein
MAASSPTRSLSSSWFRTLAAAACAAWLAAWAPAHAQAVQALTEVWPPINYLEDGKPAGYSVDVARCMFERSGVAYTIDVVPWARAYATALGTPGTVLFTTARTAERENLFRWIGPIAARRVYLFKLKRRTDIRVQTLDDVRGYVVGVMREQASEQILLANGFVKGKNLDYTLAGTNQLKKLEAGHIDFITGTEVSTMYYARSNGVDPDTLERSLLLSDEGGYYIAVSRQTEEPLVRRLQRGYEACERDGVPARLMRQYLGR